jgi:hypothetical protein
VHPCLFASFLQSQFRSVSVTLLVPNIGAVTALTQSLTATVSSHDSHETSLLSQDGSPINVTASVCLSEVTVRGRDGSHANTVPPDHSGIFEESSTSPVNVSLFPDASSWANRVCPGIYQPSDGRSPSNTEGGAKSVHVFVTGCVGKVRGPVLPVGDVRPGEPPHPLDGIITCFSGEAAYRRIAVSTHLMHPILGSAWHAIDTKASGEWLTRWSRQVTWWSGCRPIGLRNSRADSRPLPPVCISAASLGRKTKSGQYKPIGHSWVQFVGSVSQGAVLLAPSPSLLVKYRLGSITVSASMKEHPILANSLVVRVREHGVVLSKVGTSADPLTIRPRTVDRRQHPSSTLSQEYHGRTPTARGSISHASDSSHRLVERDRFIRQRAAPSLVAVESTAQLLFEQTLAVLAGNVVVKKMSAELYRRRRAILESRKDQGPGVSQPVGANDDDAAEPKDRPFVLRPLPDHHARNLASARVVNKVTVKASVGAMANTVNPQLWGELFYLYQVSLGNGIVFVLERFVHVSSGFVLQKLSNDIDEIASVLLTYREQSKAAKEEATRAAAERKARENAKHAPGHRSTRSRIQFRRNTVARAKQQSDVYHQLHSDAQGGKQPEVSESKPVRQLSSRKIEFKTKPAKLSLKLKAQNSSTTDKKATPSPIFSV